MEQPEPNMPTTCLQCSAVLEGQETCQERFDLAQSLELGQPASYAVHHLSVPCFLLQHNRYSGQGWLYARQLLVEFIRHGKSPQEIRTSNRRQVVNRHRNWSVTKGPKLPGVENIAWSFTIADIRLDTPEHYCDDVRKWAESILADTDELIRTVSA